MDKMQIKRYTGTTKANSKERTIVAHISTSDVDRDGDVMIPKGAVIEHYLENPIVLWAHKYDELPVAKAISIQRGPKFLTAKMQFPEADKYEKSDDIYNMYADGMLKAFSIGFLIKENGWHAPAEKEIKEHPEWASARRIIDKWELLEFSAVPVPANPNAFAVAVKSGSIDDKFLAEIEQFGKDANEPEPEENNDAVKVGEVLKPFPNEHSCRLKEPEQYDRFARKNCEQKHEGKCIDVIYGIDGDKSEIQALRFDKEIWTAAEARSVCKDRGGSFEAAKSEKIKVEKSKIKVKKKKEKKIVKQKKITAGLNLGELTKESLLRARGRMFID